MSVRGVVDFLTYVGLRLIVCIFQALRLETCQRLAGGLAILATDVFHIRQNIIDENLKSAFPETTTDERRDLTRRMWRHLALLVMEVAHAPRKIHHTNWRDYIQLKDARGITELLIDDRPVILVAGHFGNFELGGYSLGVFGFKTYTIARTLDNPYLDRFVNEFRAVGGQHVLPKAGSAQQADNQLSGGGALVVLADQYAGPKGCWVEFFGRPASTHKAIAVFSLANDAPLAVTYSKRVGPPLHIETGLQAVADPRTGDPALGGVRELTQWYTREIERMIRETPDQYWWVHRRWRQSDEKKRRKLVAEKAEVAAG